MRAIFRKFNDERGQALVELAFVIPLLLLFLFGIIDFGLALNNANNDTNIANYAVREAAVVGSATTVNCVNNGTTVTETTLQDWVLCETSSTGTSAPTVCVGDFSGGSPSSTYTLGDPIKVEVTSSFNWASILTNGDGYIGKISPSSTIRASATMRLEDSVSSTATTGTNSFLAPLCSS